MANFRILDCHSLINHNITIILLKCLLLNDPPHVCSHEKLVSKPQKNKTYIKTRLSFTLYATYFLLTYAIHFSILSVALLGRVNVFATFFVA